MTTPTPNDNEVIIAPNKVIMSKTSHKGVIQYANEYFKEVSGYNQKELIGKPHNIIRHPDMPKIIFKVMWEKLQKGESLYAVVKNLTKDGNYYWVVTKFETTYDENKNILAHYARRKAVPTKVKETVEDIYKIILAIEKHDEKLAEDTFYEILESHNLTYNELFLEMAGMSEKEVFDYFQSSELNTNATSENTILAIDNKQKIDLEEKIKQLQTRTEELKSELKQSNDNSQNENGFLGNLSELRDLKSALQKKNSF